MLKCRNAGMQEYRIQDTGYRIQDTGCRIQDAGLLVHWIFNG